MVLNYENSEISVHINLVKELICREKKKKKKTPLKKITFFSEFNGMEEEDSKVPTHAI